MAHFSIGQALAIHTDNFLAAYVSMIKIMSRTHRLFQVMQTLRRLPAPVTAAQLAEDAAMPPSGSDDDELEALVLG